jgi:hypothetical protein
MLFSLRFLLPYEIFRSPWYSISIVLLIAISAFGGFAVLSDYIHAKEIKIEDLHDNTQLDDKLRAKYSRRYRIIFITLSICLVGFLTYYALYVAIADGDAFATIVGIVGGIISMFGRLHRMLSEILIKYLYWCKERKKKQTPVLASLPPIFPLTSNDSKTSPEPNAPIKTTGVHVEFPPI